VIHALKHGNRVVSRDHRLLWHHFNLWVSGYGEPKFAYNNSLRTDLECNDVSFLRQSVYSIDTSESFTCTKCHAKNRSTMHYVANNVYKNMLF